MDEIFKEYNNIKANIFKKNYKRIIKPGIEELNYGNNNYKSHKYNLFTILPIFTWNFFSNKINFIYLIASILQSIPIFSTTKNIPYSLIPLIISFIFNFLLDVILYIKRKKFDSERNETFYSKLSNDGEVNIKSKDIKVGDLIIINKNEIIPADCIILSNSNNDKNCNIKTFSYKEIYEQKQIPYNLFNATENMDFKKFKNEILDKCILISDETNENIYSYFGCLYYDLDTEKDILDIENLVFRDSKLWDDKSILVWVLYNGDDCKLKNNNNKFMEKGILNLEINKLLDISLLILIIYSLICSINYIIINTIWYKYYLKFKHYKFYEELFYKFLNWMQLFINLVPISLYPSIRLIRIIKGYDSNLEFLKNLLLPNYICTRSDWFFNKSNLEFNSIISENKILVDIKNLINNEDLIISIILLMDYKILYYNIFQPIKNEDKKLLQLLENVGIKLLAIDLDENKYKISINGKILHIKIHFKLFSESYKFCLIEILEKNLTKIIFKENWMLVDKIMNVNYNNREGLELIKNIEDQGNIAYTYSYMQVSNNEINEIILNLNSNDKLIFKYCNDNILLGGITFKYNIDNNISSITDKLIKMDNKFITFCNENSEIVEGYLQEIKLVDNSKVLNLINKDENLQEEINDIIKSYEANEHKIAIIDESFINEIKLLKSNTIIKKVYGVLKELKFIFLIKLTKKSKKNFLKNLSKFLNKEIINTNIIGIDNNKEFIKHTDIQIYHKDINNWEYSPYNYDIDVSSLEDFLKIINLVISKKNNLCDYNNLIKFWFFKNLLIIFPYLFYGIYNYYSGLNLYDLAADQLFSILFTLVPIILFITLDKKKILNHHKEKGIVLKSIVISGSIYYSSLVLFESHFLKNNGETFGYWVFGHMIMYGVVLYTNFKLYLITHLQIIKISVIASLISFFFVWYILNIIEFNYLYGTFFDVIFSKSFVFYNLVIFGINIWDIQIKIL